MKKLIVLFTILLSGLLVNQNAFGEFDEFYLTTFLAKQYLKDTYSTEAFEVKIRISTKVKVNKKEIIVSKKFKKVIDIVDNNSRNLHKQFCSAFIETGWQACDRSTSLNEVGEIILSHEERMKGIVIFADIYVDTDHKHMKKRKNMTKFTREVIEKLEYYIIYNYRLKF